MDLSSLTSDKKQKKRCKGEEKDENSIGIRICDLPDHILQLIISCLPTKDAIRTSVLSKEWVHLIGLEELQFIDFVRRLLVVFDCTNLKRFALSFEVGKDTFLVNEWLHRFISPKIQELRLDLQGIDTTCFFPDHLFACATLREFQLRMREIFMLPNSIHFESLRTLTLRDVAFRDGYSTHQLFSGCPSLEELTLIDCDWGNVQTVTISPPLLKKIIIRESEKEDDYGGYVPHEDDDNVRNRCQIWIIGTNLKAFSYDGANRNDYFLYSSTSVINASIMILPDFFRDNSIRDAAGYFVLRLLGALSSVESLSIADDSLLVMSRLLRHLPLLSNLAELNVVSVTPEELSCVALLAILQNSPRLQVINFEELLLPKDCANYELDSLCICFRTHLKTIRINRFYGLKRELDAIKNMLGSASVLEKLYICSYPCSIDPHLRSEKLKELSQQIGSFPRASMHCEIDYENF